MKHLFVTHDYGPDLGGMARRHVELCRRLAATEYLTVSTISADGSEAFDSGEGYPIERQPFDVVAARRFDRQMRWARALTDTLRGDTATVIHCGNVRPPGYGVWWANRTTRVPYVVYVNGGDLLRERAKADNPIKRWSAKRIFGDAAGVVANSRWTADLAADVMRECGVTRAPRIAAIDLGTDPDQFAPHHDRGRVRARFAIGDAPLLLTVARLVPHKGQDTAIRALAALRSEYPTLRYLLVGEGHDEARLRALAGSLGVGDAVIFAGALSDDEIADAYATATIYVGLSRADAVVNAEGFGISFVEASASGVPVVAGDSGGVRSAVRDGETGIVVTPTDVDAATGAIRTLLADDDRRDGMGRAGRRAVETHYNWDRVARETRDFVGAVTGR